MEKLKRKITLFYWSIFARKKWYEYYRLGIIAAYYDIPTDEVEDIAFKLTKVKFKKSLNHGTKKR